MSGVNIGKRFNSYCFNCYLFVNPQFHSVQQLLHKVTYRFAN